MSTALDNKKDILSGDIIFCIEGVNIGIKMFIPNIILFLLIKQREPPSYGGFS
jgi:hypothetical protein